LEAATPGFISLLAGRPNPTTFPFTSFNFTVQSPIDPTSELDMSIEGDDLTEALQYGATPGLPKLLNWVRGLQDFLHGRKDNEGWTISMGCESGELLFKVMAGSLILPTYWN
jgi:tryptophan aminotransferase